MATSLQRTALFEAIQKHDPASTAIVHSVSNRSFTYGGLLADVAAAKTRLLKANGKDSIGGERVAFLIENSYDYVVTLLAIIACNAIAVPLSPSFPAGELRYCLNQSQAISLLYSDKFSKLALQTLEEGLDKKPINLKVEKITSQSTDATSVELSGDINSKDGGLMLYTSGTTARPKGVFLPQTALAAQSKSLVQAWQYTPQDWLLHVLPLHHIHGTVNAILAPLFSGSTIEFMFPFNPDSVWTRFAQPFISNNPDPPRHPITFFTVVPTIWSRLLSTFNALPTTLHPAARTAISRSNLRLNISGSAALPTPTKKAWTTLSNGNVLLERYGMTEVGMALSCGLADVDRIDGAVGWPLPGVSARLVDSDTGKVIAVEEEVDAEGKERQGEIQLKGETIFKEYFNNAEATRKEFTEDGWFKTGDIAVRRKVEGAGEGKSGDWAVGPAYFILGRKSADIIKTGGEKVSALEVEREMLALPQVKECAAVGLPSEAWGQKIAAVVVLTEEGKTAGKNGKEWSALDLRKALKSVLVAYKIPQDMKIVEEIPRNAMGKVNKKELVKVVFGDPDAIRRRSIDVAEEKARSKAS